MRPVPPHDYYHPEDRVALDAMKQIPGFSTLLKAFMKIFSEKVMYGMSMAQKIRLGPNQLPEIYNLLPPICKRLAIDEPALFLEMDPSPNAYTYGETQSLITITSGLIEQMKPEEITAVIAHECGHIACKHVLYHTLATYVLSAGADILGLGVITLPIKLALLKWQRCSELSCDRAAAICMQGPDTVVDVMVRLSGGGSAVLDLVNREEYLSQADEYNEILSGSSFDKALQFIAVMGHTHPFMTVRAKEVLDWCKSPEYQRIHEYTNQEGNSCPKCGSEVDPSWAFCKKCGNKI